MLLKFKKMKAIAFLLCALSSRCPSPVKILPHASSELEHFVMSCWNNDSIVCLKPAEILQGSFNYQVAFKLAVYDISRSPDGLINGCLHIFVLFESLLYAW